MRYRLLQSIFAQKRVAKASMSICVVGLYLESLLEVRDCFVDLPFCKKNVSAVVVGFSVVRLQLYCLFEVGHRFIGLPFSRQSVAEIHFYERGTEVVMRI